MAIAKKVKLKNSKGEVLIPYIGEIGSPHDIGEIFSAPYTEKYTPKGAVPANGKEYRAGAYTDFWNNFVITGLVETCTYQEFDADVAKIGGCGKYAIDTSARTFKVPLIGDGVFISGATTTGESGKAYAQSLPNLRGNETGLDFGGDGWTNRVFKTIEKLKGSSAGNQHEVSRNEFDANAYDNTYQDGAKVQPNNIRMRWFCQLASGEINKADLDLNGLRADIANSANRDLSNVTANIDFVKDSGSNAEQKYIRFKNGTLIIWGNFANNKTETKTFIRPFKEVPSLLTVPHYSGRTYSPAWSQLGYDITTTGFSISPKDGTSGYTSSFIAIGIGA